jgi:hypothetical protein
MGSMAASADVENLVKRLHDAFNASGALGFGSTDEDAVYKAFEEAGDRGIMRDVETRYNALYEKDELSLRAELDDELSGEELEKAVALYEAAKKPKSGTGSSPSPTASPKPAAKRSHCDATLVPKAGEQHPPCDPKMNVKKPTPGYGISVSPESKLSACQIVQMIKRNQRLAPWMRDMFFVNATGNRIGITGKKPDGIKLPGWFETLLMAFEPKPVPIPAGQRGRPYLANWHITTGVANVHKGPVKVQNRLRGDYEPHDVPSGLGGGEDSDGIIAGLTFRNKSGSHAEAGLYEIFEDKAGGTKRGKAPHYRLPAIPAESRAPEGLIVFADRYCRKDGSDERIRTNEDAILETLFHELSVHAGRITTGQGSDHGLIDFHVPDGDEGDLPPVDRLSWEIWKFFGKADESCLIDALR